MSIQREHQQQKMRREGKRRRGVEKFRGVKRRRGKRREKYRNASNVLYFGRSKAAADYQRDGEGKINVGNDDHEAEVRRRLDNNAARIYDSPQMLISIEAMREGAPRTGTQCSDNNILRTRYEGIKEGTKIG